MTNVTSLSAHRSCALPTAAPQQSGNTITLQQAIARGITAEQLRAVANWNERKGYDERRRRARQRHKAQAIALRDVAGRLQIAQHMQMAEAA